MKKSIILLTIALLIAFFSNGQVFKKVSQEEMEKHFWSNPDVQALTQRDSTKRPIKIILIINCCGGVINLRVDNPQVDEGSGTHTLENEKAKEQVFMASIKGTDTKTKKEVNLSMVKNLLTNQVSVWAEDGTHQYTITRKDKSKPEIVRTPLTTAKSSFSKITSCFNAFKKANGPSNCSNCFSCLQKCTSKKTRWQRINCALSSCSSSCWACVTSVYGFITCVF